MIGLPKFASQTHFPSPIRRRTHGEPMIDGFVFRVIALVLIPCLVVDPAWANFGFAATSRSAIRDPQSEIYTSQAVVPFLSWFTLPAIDKVAQSKVPRLIKRTILIGATETPTQKKGGLGDFVGGLDHALARHDNQVI